MGSRSIVTQHQCLEQPDSMPWQGDTGISCPALMMGISISHGMELIAAIDWAGVAAIGLLPPTMTMASTANMNWRINRIILLTTISLQL